MTRRQETTASQKPIKTGALVLLSVLAVFVIAILDGDDSRDDGRAAVSGTVSCNGQPLEAGTIRFTPASETTGPSARGNIENGRFRIPAAEGPFTGAYNVSIEVGLLERTAFEVKRPLAEFPDFATVEIVDGENEIEFDVPFEQETDVTTSVR